MQQLRQEVKCLLQVYSVVYEDLVSYCLVGPQGPPTITLCFIGGQEASKTSERVGTRCKVRT